MGHRYLATLVVAATAALTGLSATAAHATEAPGSPGSVRYMKGAGSDFDRYSSNPAWTGWMNERFWRMRTYTPYFDAKTAGYSRGWFYRNLYGIAKDSSIAREHPDWILKDPAGNQLYIPWGCAGGTCPNYAGDFGNPAFRSWWISQARATLARGYRGIWIDDVNLIYRAGDGTGRIVAPMDPRSGTTMSESVWRSTMADFLEAIRAAVPDREIVHNAIWYSPESDPSVDRAVRAADYINLERGVNDGGLTRGGGTYGYRSFLAYVDRRHDEGHAVVLDAYANTLAEREYGLASYFLVTNGADGYSNATGSAPDDWWAGWNVSLGDARGPRTSWSGLLRRDFVGGMALVNEPGAPKVTVALGGTYYRIDGSAVTSVELGPAQGVVLRRSGESLSEPVVVTIDGSQSPLEAPGPSAAPSAASPPAAARPQPCNGRSCGRLSLKVTKRRASSARRKRSAGATLRGSARGSAAGRRARVSLYRQAGRRWVPLRRASAAMSRQGRFRVVFSDLPSGRYRVGANVSHGSASSQGAAASVRFRL